MKNKNAAIGATMTWVVATIILLFVIIIFVYASLVISKGKKAENIHISPYIESEQMLLALLETKINGKLVKDYIIEGNYDELDKPEFRDKVLTGLPEPGTDGWHIYIYEKDNLVKKIKSSQGTLSVAESKVSEVYLGDKKVRLFLNSAYFYY